MITVGLGDNGEITHVINDTGEATAMKPRVTPKVTEFPLTSATNAGPCLRGELLKRQY